MGKKVRDANSSKTAIGARLRDRRLQLNYTQKFVADTLGVKTPSVSGWERGSASPDKANALKLSKLLNVSIEWILTGDDAPDDAPSSSGSGTRAKVGAARPEKGMSRTEMQDFDLTIGDLAQRLYDVYREEGYALSVKDAVCLAYTFHTENGPFSSDQAAEMAVGAEIDRVRRFLKTLPRPLK